MYFIITTLISLFLLSVGFIFRKLTYKSIAQFQEKLNFYKQDIYQFEKTNIQTTSSVSGDKITKHVSNSLD